MNTLEAVRIATITGKSVGILDYVLMILERIDEPDDTIKKVIELLKTAHNDLKTMYTTGDQ